MKSRREFVVALAKCTAIILAPIAALRAVSGRGEAQTLGDAGATSGRKAKRWAFLVDTTKCTGCGLCVQACKLENEVPLEANVSRTWVERYVMTRDFKVHVDSPKAAVNGFTSDALDLGHSGEEKIDPAEITKSFFVPKLCNQCANPPCVQVCPVGATYRTEDGVVLIDRKTCIGCGYCVMACPYGARFFHPVHKVAEKCTFCYHRISNGMKPACVEACPFGARAFGNLEDQEDPVTQAVMSERVGVLKDDYGCKPQVYYIGLSKEVR